MKSKVYKALLRKDEALFLAGLESVPLPANDPYLLSYPHLLAFFKSAPVNRPMLVQGAHMVYGWMPTALDVDFASMDAAVDALAKAKSGGALNKDALECLFATVNNSMVGASKLLHFIHPEKYPIIDSVLYAYLYNRAHDGRILASDGIYPIADKPAFYLAWQEAVLHWAGEERGKNIAQAINRQLELLGYGYQVTRGRAIELAMFTKWKTERAVAAPRA